MALSRRPPPLSGHRMHGHTIGQPLMSLADPWMLPGPRLSATAGQLSQAGWHTRSGPFRRLGPSGRVALARLCPCCNGSFFLGSVTMSLCESHGRGLLSASIIAVIFGC